MPYHLTAFVTFLTVIVYFWMAAQVSRTRVKVGSWHP